MQRTIGMFIRGLVVCALICVATSVSQAATIIKLNLGGVGPDVGMGPGGLLSTTNDTIIATTGDQNTDIEYTGPLDFLADLNTNTASFTLSGLNASGPANVFGSLVIQNFLGGQFTLYDPGNNILLQGPLTNSALTGVLGPPGTGALFTTTLGNFTPNGSLNQYLAQGSVSLSMNMTNVNGGAGFSVSGGGPELNQFLADGAVTISADPIPEPASLVLLGFGAIAGLAFGARRRR